MSYPLTNPAHFLYGNPFAEQCRLVIEEEDPCRLFGLDQSAEKSEVNRVYRRLAFHFHPDHHTEEKILATQAMSRIIAARESFDLPVGCSPPQSFTANQAPIRAPIRRMRAWLDDLITNAPRKPDESIALDDADDDELLCRVYWQRIDNSIDGKGTTLNPELINKIKSRILTDDNGVPDLLIKKFPARGHTLLQFIACSEEVNFFRWLLKNAPNPNDILYAQDSGGQTCIYFALYNRNPRARQGIFSLICNAISVNSLHDELLYILETAQVGKDAFDLVVDSLPDKYLDTRAVSIAKKNPLFLMHIGRFVEDVVKDLLITNALRENPGNYQYLATEDKLNLRYITLAFSLEKGRSQANVDALPLKKLPINCVAALPVVWPGLEDKLLNRLDTNPDGSFVYGKIKNSWAYLASDTQRMRMLGIFNICMVPALVLFALAAPIPIIMPLLCFGAGILLSLGVQAYCAYQWCNKRSYVNKIRLFQEDVSSETKNRWLEAPYKEDQAGQSIPK